jgi:RNA polymerase primary sigma factor
MVYDDLGVYFTALMSKYPALVADWLSAKADGDEDDLQSIEAEMRALEEHVGVRRDDAWYVVVNVLSNYDLVEKIIQRVTTAYMRLLFRFAHRVRGITTTEENFSAGCEGMIRAVRNYDPIDGSSFTIHCQWWVRSAILQRQRQASVILLPSTTWSQLAQIQKGQGSFSDERVADLKERAEMFFANSANALKAQDREQDDYDDPFEGVLVTSPDAAVVLGDAVARSQSVEDAYESKDVAALGKSIMDNVFHLLHEEDPSLIFPVLLWALNSGIDATLLAERSACLFLGEKEIQQERERQRHDSQSESATKPTKPSRRIGTKPHRTGRHGHTAKSKPAYKNAFALG